MTNPPPSRREARLPWWPTLSLICAGYCAVQLCRRLTDAPPSRALRRGSGGGDPVRDDAAAHLTTSW
ncbi:hypothetical protein ACFWUQ_02880 [Streptomyces sp. NPDC058662]|uniref:hypothetical protein n=1 Tax=Streptomyces sp. NPDC058662 TaxID=3346583 RepID=UPI00365F9702